METAFSSKQMESAYKVIWCHNVEDHMLNLRLYSNRNALHYMNVMLFCGCKELPTITTVPK